MAISPNELMDYYENPKLSKKDEESVKKLVKIIDKDIIQKYGNEYIQDINYIPNDFDYHIYLSYELSRFNLDDIILVKAYLLNEYSRKGWDITVDRNWKWYMRFDKSKMRENVIDSLLDDEKIKEGN